MKFSHSLQFNAVPEWSNKYIAYSTLKKLIYRLQSESLRTGDQERLLSSHQGDPSAVFIAALDAECSKINTFYKKQEEIAHLQVDELEADVQEYEREVASSAAGNRKNSLFQYVTHSSATDGGDTDNITDYPEDEPGSASDAALRRASMGSQLSEDGQRAANTSTSLPHIAHLAETRVILRKRIIGMFTTLSELKSYIELNETGFKKALKKFDKSLNTSIKDEYLSSLGDRTYVFNPTTIAQLNEKIDEVVGMYADICAQPKDQARSELSVHLREHVVWERNTVWRDMIGIERKAEAAGKPAEKESSSSLQLGSRIIKVSVIAAITAILLVWSPFKDTAQAHCFALLVCASLLWATEAIPLFCTSLLVPMLIVNLKVLKNDDGSLMDGPEASKFILGSQWNSVILLLLGGFTLAAALSKYHIAKLLSTWILSKAGTRPPAVLLTVMSVALFASMWVSNVAAPVLCFSLIQPLLRTLPKESQFIKALILGIALASNVGGMASPIASPQNIVAIGAMDPPPSWGQWFVVALPVCLLSVVLIWFLLLVTFDCRSRNTRIVPIRVIDEKFTGTQWFITFITIGTIALWCVASKLTGVFGEMGIISLIPMILLFGSGLLTTEDFNNYPWNIVVLAMGGTALGKAVASSGLLATIAEGIQRQVEGFSLFAVTLTFGLLILIMATFVSHTVAALIVIPLVSEIGNELPEPHPRLLIMAAALLCSAAMGLPTSGFPNVTAICMTDEFGKPYLTVGTFITRGVPSSLIAYGIIVTVGYATMKLIHF
ncbi:hypothetical protein DIURU_002297 [Diutina rugosa]|uniref:SPX domain-containing protein n=1 Tax=Diutina rugosa TaxID=5481 RepID=A0A642UVP3_DIURU|nr:uncharacterized protein DIURU_002297 [Diutina rugosa]KAA8903785.1 hypothetical protein DIURU_002297 [Diutina rugosa]